MAERGRSIDPTLPTIAEILKAKGYETAAIVARGPLMPSLGFDRGFGTFVEIEPRDGQDIGRVVDKAMDYILQAKGPFFLYLHSLEVHLPDTRGDYSSDLAGADAALKPLLQTLDAIDATVLFFSDHGEDPTREEGRHGFDLKEDLLHVPLIFRSKRLPPGQLTIPVQLVDLFPTALDILGIQATSPGDSLLAVDAIDPDRPVVSGAPFHGREWLSVLRGNYRLIFRPAAARQKDARSEWWWQEPIGPALSLFNVNDDPGCMLDLMGSEPEIEARLLSDLAEIRRNQAAFR